jgi:tetratricopeptide (TPR) repeat protein
MLSTARALLKSGRLGDAQAVLAEILRANGEHAEALHLSGVIAAMQGAPERAVDLLGRAIRLDPANPSAHLDLGVALKGLRQFAAALRCYDKAIELDPDRAEAHNNRGNILRDLNDPQAAIDSYHRALELRPQYAEAHHNLGVALSDLNQWQAALAHYDHAIAVRPDYANCYCSRGLALERLNRPQAALADYDRALAIAGGLTQALVNRGNVLRELGRVDAALASCDLALERSPDNAQAHLNRSLALLVSGDYAAGWPEYEWRWRNPHGRLSGDAHRFTRPLWLGEQALEGKSILLHAEQGLGDTLQFCRYVTVVAGRGARVILEVQRPLAGLLGTLDGADEVISRGESLGDFDYHCPLMSLPLAFGTTLATVPSQTPYLKADPLKAQRWRERVGPRAALRVGLVWSGGHRPEQPELWALHGRRNIALALLAPLRSAPAQFYSLQKGQPAEAELAALTAQRWDGPRIHDMTVDLQDFSDTAALIDQLDLVISVDTSTAHLAAAMGKPVWLLNRYDTCWRWLLERESSPWYPTMRLYRQPRLGDWESVVRRVCSDLARGP